ncbi:MAG: SH3 domain-containing protein [Clostridia bacterium]|nr:SH3 domain-containing protein [Clostridia bacterium]
MDTLRFITCVLQNAARIQGYELGHDGSDGTSDCIGLIVGAVRLAGESWPGIQGTNYTARYLVRDLAKDGALSVGGLVFKAKAPGEPGYALPARYENSGDKLDYYHVGVVLQTEPLLIVHCTTGGIHLDTARGAWRYGAWLNLVAQDVPLPCDMTVVAESGSTVNLRSGPGTGYPILAQVPLGETVRALEGENAGWMRVRWQNREGYMMRRFLELSLPPEDERLEQFLLLREQVDAILAAAQAAREAIDALGAWGASSVPQTS